MNEEHPTADDYRNRAERAEQFAGELMAENERLREAIANQANSFNIVGSHYDAAVTALGAMVSEVKRNARAALGQPR